MANHRLLKRNTSLWPFLLGLILGLILSMAIRILSSKTSLFCRKINRSAVEVPESYHYSKRGIKLEPDQIVNLDYGRNLFAVNGLKKQSNSSSLKANNINGEAVRELADDSEILQENLLLVGVMTAEKYLNSRALGVYETWAKSIPGKVIFFTGGNSSEINGNQDSDSGMPSLKHESVSIPLVALPGVDDSYPPQKKSFMMLKYMYEHFGDKFEWFMRADDDVYIRTEKLSDFLRSINSRHLYFIGQAGRGNRAEKGTLNLGQNENFCMGGPGIILSKPTLAKVAPNVHQCLQDMYSTHEDVEVGRCVQRFAGISCTWAYEMQSIFHHNSSGEKAFTDTLKRREVHKAITLHPIKNFQYLYRLHAYFQELKIQELFYESILLQRELFSLHSKSTAQNIAEAHKSLLRDSVQNDASKRDRTLTWSHKNKQLNIMGNKENVSLPHF